MTRRILRSHFVWFLGIAIVASTCLPRVLADTEDIRLTQMWDDPLTAGPPLIQPDAASLSTSEYWSLWYCFLLASFIGLGVISRVSRFLHTPLMSLTNAISAIAVVGSILVTGSDYPVGIRLMGAVALFASMTNIVSGFLITDRMLRMFQRPREESRP